MAERRGFGVQARTTIVAVLVVAVAVAIASVAMLEFVERTIVGQIADGAELDALEIAAASDAGGRPVAGDPSETFVQILDGGRVVTSSENVAGSPPIADPAPDTTERIDAVPFAEGPFVVVGVADGSQTIVVGHSVDDATEARLAVGTALLIGIPVLLILVGLLTWAATGHALRPVDQIRAEVDRIGASELARRVPEVGGDDAVAKLARTMNRMLDRLERSSERQRRFVSDASHELRSPVASIRQHAEVGREHPESTSVRELATAITVEAERLQVLVEDLLLLARLDEGAPAARVEVDLDDLVLAEGARLRAATGMRIHTSQVAAGRVIGDRLALARAVGNLADNAARFARSTIVLGVRTQDGRVLVTVEDDGPGIPQADRVRVLDRFVRLDEGRGRDAGGTGLGLAIVRQVAVSHGGRLRLGSGRLGGLRAELALPAVGGSASGQEASRILEADAPHGRRS